jgi:hypothetical protein
MLGRRRAGTTGLPSITTLPQGDLGAVDGHDRHHDLGVGQDLGGSVGLEGHRPQDGGEGVAAMPQLSGWVELEAASVLLGVDDEHAARADHQVDAPMVVNLR